MENHWLDKIDTSKREGLEEEFEVMCALAHQVDFVWMTPNYIAKKTGISLERVKSILDKMVSCGLVVIHPKKPGFYGELESTRMWL